jgi:peptide/nickel transport system substrate-binding protein
MIMITAKLRDLLLHLLLCSLMFALAESCHDLQDKTPSRSARRGGKVVICWSTDLGGVNPLTLHSGIASDEILNQMFLRLFEEQPDFADHPPTLTPQLAFFRSWSDHHKTLTLSLRKNVLWSDGVPVTADDVRWTWQAERNEDVRWDRKHMKDGITDVEVVNPETVRFHFSHVYAKQMLDANEGVILPKHSWSGLPFREWRKNPDWFRTHLVVDGPFRLSQWSKNKEIRLRRNDLYFDSARPNLDEVIFRIEPSEKKRSELLFSRAVDFISQVSPDDAVHIAKDSKLVLIAFWYRVVSAVAWNNERPPFDDREVRRALAIGVDRKSIVNQLFYRSYVSYGRLATSPIVASAWAHNHNLSLLPYDPNEARRILTSKGFVAINGDGTLYRNGKPFSFTLRTNMENDERTKAAQEIARQLGTIGVRVQVAAQEFDKLNDELNAGDFDAAIIGLSMDTSFDLTEHFATSSIERGENYARYSNPQVDDLIASAMRNKYILDSRPELNRVQMILNEDEPYTLLWESQRLNAVNVRVHDVRPNALFSLANLQEWRIDAQ